VKNSKSIIDSTAILILVLVGVNLIWQFISRVFSDYKHYQDSKELFNQGLLKEELVTDNWNYLIESLTEYYWFYLLIGLFFLFIAKRLWSRRKAQKYK
jgi:hypothetical protein